MRQDWLLSDWAKVKRVLSGPNSQMHVKASGSGRGALQKNM